MLVKSTSLPALPTYCMPRYADAHVISQAAQLAVPVPMSSTHARAVQDSRARHHMVLLPHSPRTQGGAGSEILPLVFQGEAGPVPGNHGLGAEDAHSPLADLAQGHFAIPLSDGNAQNSGLLPINVEPLQFPILGLAPELYADEPAIEVRPLVGHKRSAHEAALDLPDTATMQPHKPALFSLAQAACRKNDYTWYHPDRTEIVKNIQSIMDDKMEERLTQPCSAYLVEIGHTTRAQARALSSAELVCTALDVVFDGVVKDISMHGCASSPLHAISLMYSMFFDKCKLVFRHDTPEKKKTKALINHYVQEAFPKPVGLKIEVLRFQAYVKHTQLFGRYFPIYNHIQEQLNTKNDLGGRVTSRMSDLVRLVEHGGKFFASRFTPQTDGWHPIEQLLAGILKTDGSFDEENIKAVTTALAKTDKSGSNNGTRGIFEKLVRCVVCALTELRYIPAPVQVDGYRAVLG
jgi:hypothetical protein